MRVASCTERSANCDCKSPAGHRSGHSRGLVERWRAFSLMFLPAQGDERIADGEGQPQHKRLEAAPHTSYAYSAYIRLMTGVKRLG